MWGVWGCLILKDWCCTGCGVGCVGLFDTEGLVRRGSLICGMTVKAIKRRDCSASDSYDVKEVGQVGGWGVGSNPTETTFWDRLARSVAVLATIQDPTQIMLESCPLYELRKGI